MLSTSDTTGRETASASSAKGGPKEIVKDRLKKVVQELDEGIDTSDTYSVENAVRDWLARGTKGLSAKTIGDYRSLANVNVYPLIGGYKLKRLTADNVDDWLDGLADRLATATLRKVHSILRRSIRHAQARNRVSRNVAQLVDTPTYGGDLTGTSTSTGPTAGQVLETFRGNGTGTADVILMTQTQGPLSFNDEPVTYTLNGNCTGTLTALRGGEAHHFDIAVTDSGRTIYQLRIDTGSALAGTLEHV